MISTKVCELLSSALIVGSLYLPIGSRSFAYAQEPGMDDLCGTNSRTGDTMVDHIVLHGVRLQSRSNKIDNYSIAALDYLARFIKDDPRPIVCVEILPVRSGAELRPERQATVMYRQAVAINSYLEKKGVDIRKLVLVTSAPG